MVRGPGTCRLSRDRLDGHKYRDFSEPNGTCSRLGLKGSSKIDSDSFGRMFDPSSSSSSARFVARDRSPNVAVGSKYNSCG